MAYIKSFRNQNYILPPNITDLFSENHVCYLIEQITDDLNYSEFDEKYAGAGHPAYYPRIPLKLLLMASVDGVRSSRRIAKQSSENVVYIYLSEKTQPDFRTISDFRKDNKKLLKNVFLQLNKFALEKGLIDLSHIFTDGTSVKANANNRKTIDKETLEKLSKYIDEVIEEGIKVDEEELMEIALEAGAEDIKSEDQYHEITCDISNLRPIKEAIEAKSIPMETVEMTMLPSVSVKVVGADAKTLMGLMEALEDQEDVQNVYANFDIPDEEMDKIAEG